MIEKAFKTSTLVMPDHPLEGITTDPTWLDVPVNRIMAIVGLCLFLMTFLSFLRILPTLLDCLSRGRANTTMEHNLQLKRTRDLILLAYFIIQAILFDRFDLIPSERIATLPPGVSLAACAGVMGAYFAIRQIAHSIIHPKSSRSLQNETVAASHHVCYNCIIILTAAMLVTTGILCLTKAEDSVFRLVLWIEIGVFYLINLIRTGEILLPYEGVFTTFLYLCGLEFLPTALLIAGVLYL